MEALQTQSYWEETGKYQKQYNTLYSELVSGVGTAETVNGELLRAATRLMYEFFNNGNCNACEHRRAGSRCDSCHGDGEDEDGDECIYCDGSGMQDDDAFISIFYQNFLEFIIKYISESKPVIKKVGLIILADLYSSSTQFSDQNMASYNAMMDLVIEYVIKNENKPLSQ